MAPDAATHAARRRRNAAPNGRRASAGRRKSAPKGTRSARGGGRPGPRRRSKPAGLRLLSLRGLAAIGLVAMVLAAVYALWLRNSSLVAVTEVEVAGATVAEEEVAAALASAAKGMTTLNVDVGELEAAVEEFPTVESVAADASFPHRLTISVEERAPVGRIGDVLVAGDGIVLTGMSADGLEVPKIKAEDVGSAARLSGDPLSQATVLGAAPPGLRPVIERSRLAEEHGVVVELRGGIELRFGEPNDAAAKWAAAAAVLADPRLDSLAYIDLRVPDRPAVGGAPAAGPGDPAAGVAAEATAYETAEPAPQSQPPAGQPETATAGSGETAPAPATAAATPAPATDPATGAATDPAAAPTGAAAAP